MLPAKEVRNVLPFLVRSLGLALYLQHTVETCVARNLNLSDAELG